MIDQVELKRLLTYSEETGVFVWNMNRGGFVKKGDIAGTTDKLGYVRIKAGDRVHLAHRLAWLYVYGYFPTKTLDHLNRNPSDNRISNLIEAGQEVNNKNSSKRKDNVSGVTGVNFSSQKKKWVAQIQDCGVKIYLGAYDSFEDAVKVRKEAELRFSFSEGHGLPRPTTSAS